VAGVSVTVGATSTDPPSDVSRGGSDSMTPSDGLSGIGSSDDTSGKPLSSVVNEELSTSTVPVEVPASLSSASHDGDSVDHVDVSMISVSPDSVVPVEVSGESIVPECVLSEVSRASAEISGEFVSSSWLVWMPGRPPMIAIQSNTVSCDVAQSIWIVNPVTPLFVTRYLTKTLELTTT
jgi:hypothetical protein